MPVQSGGMETKSGRVKIVVSDFSEFSWPVKVRVRTHTHLVVPRKSPTFPASNLFEQKQPRMLLRTLESPKQGPCRRAFGAFDRPLRARFPKLLEAKWTRC